MWQDFGPRMLEIQHKVDAHTAFGVSANIDHETGEFDYVAGFQVEDAAVIPAGMASMEIPEASYAVFATTLLAIGQTFDNAHQKWIPQAGYRPTGGTELEVYDEGFDPQDPTSTFEVYIPVE
jgi:AraC family transcriptional regulator